MQRLLLIDVNFTSTLNMGNAIYRQFSFQMCYIELAFVENKKFDFRCNMISGLAWSVVNWGV